MDTSVMELRLKQWMPIFEEQAKSGLNKQDWCDQNGVKRSVFFKWQRLCRAYILSKNETRIASADTTFVELSCDQQRSEVVDASYETAAVSANNSSIVISRNGFSISLAGRVDEGNLTSVLRAISHVK